MVAVVVAGVAAFPEVMQTVAYRLHPLAVENGARRRAMKLSIAFHRLVLHRSAEPTGVAKYRIRTVNAISRALRHALRQNEKKP